MRDLPPALAELVKRHRSENLFRDFPDPALQIVVATLRAVAAVIRQGGVSFYPPEMKLDSWALLIERGDPTEGA